MFTVTLLGAGSGGRRVGGVCFLRSKMLQWRSSVLGSS